MYSLNINEVNFKKLPMAINGENSAHKQMINTSVNGQCNTKTKPSKSSPFRHYSCIFLIPSNIPFKKTCSAINQTNVRGKKISQTRKWKVKDKQSL